MKILIADDDYSSRRLLEGILSPYGECVFAENGTETVEKFTAGLSQGHPFDLVCLDIMMPEMDGQVALAQIRAAEKKHQVPSGEETVIIMVTALNALQTVVKSFESGGCNAYLTKPVTKKALLEKIKNYGLIAAS